MKIDYCRESEKFRPKQIKTLLVGEAPPPGGDKYFYVPCSIPLRGPVELDRSLPATIFNHFFQSRPADATEYLDMLCRLQQLGIFLVDICEEPVRVRNNPAGLMRIVSEIPLLRERLLARGITVDDTAIIFLLARRNYAANIRQEFPTSTLVRWIDFRIRGRRFKRV